MSKNNYINIILISGSGVIAGLLNYIYHPIILNYLTIEEFGVFGSLVGMFNILGVLTVGISLFINREVSKNINDKQKIKFIFTKSTKLLFLLGLFLFMTFVLFSPIIANFLKIDNVYLVAMIGIILVISFTGSTIDAIIRGLKRFDILSGISIVGPLVKLCSGFFLIFLGFKIYGAVIGFLLSSLVGTLIGFFYIKYTLKEYNHKGNIKDLISDFSQNKKYLFNFFFISFFFSIFMNADIILAKNIFDTTSAGIYSGVSILGKFLIFLLLSIETVYFSQIMEYKKNDIPKHLIKNPIILLVITSISAIIFCYFFGDFILYILKPELTEYLNIFLLILVYYTFLALTSLLSKILIGWGKNYVNLIFLLVITILLFLVYTIGNSNILYFIYSFIFSGLLLFIMIFIYFIYEINNNSDDYLNCK